MLLNVLPHDRAVYEKELKDFLPDTFVDCHAHVWLDEFKFQESIREGSQNWPLMVAKDNPIEDLIETNQLLFPDKKVVGVYSKEVIYGGGNIHCITQQQPK